MRRRCRTRGTRRSEIVSGYREYRLRACSGPHRRMHPSKPLRLLHQMNLILPYELNTLGVIIHNHEDGRLEAIFSLFAEHPDEARTIGAQVFGKALRSLSLTPTNQKAIIDQTLDIDADDCDVRGVMRQVTTKLDGGTEGLLRPEDYLGIDPCPRCGDFGVLYNGQPCPECEPE